MKTLDEINRLIAVTEAELAVHESSRSKLLLRAGELQREKAALLRPSGVFDSNGKPIVTTKMRR